MTNMKKKKSPPKTVNSLSKLTPRQRRNLREKPLSVSPPVHDRFKAFCQSSGLVPLNFADRVITEALDAYDQNGVKVFNEGNLKP